MNERDDTAWLQDYIDNQDINRTRTLTLPHGRWRISKPLRIVVDRPVTEEDPLMVVSDILGLNCDLVAPGLKNPYNIVVQRKH